MCDLGQVTSSLWASVSFSLKQGATEIVKAQNLSLLTSRHPVCADVILYEAKLLNAQSRPPTEECSYETIILIWEAI